MSDDKVVPLFGGAPTPPADEPDAAIIATCEALLEDARAGKLTAIAICSVHANGAVSRGWHHGAGSVMQLAGALMYLSARYSDYLASETWATPRA